MKASTANNDLCDDKTCNVYYEMIDELDTLYRVEYGITGDLYNIREKMFAYLDTFDSLTNVRRVWAEFDDGKVHYLKNRLGAEQAIVNMEEFMWVKLRATKL